MIRSIFILILSLQLFYSGAAFAAQNGPRHSDVAQTEVNHAPNNQSAGAPVKTKQYDRYSRSTASENEYSAALTRSKKETEAIILLLIQSLIAGLLTVFTPYVFTIHPFTVGYLVRDVPSAGARVMNTLVYACSLIAIFTLLGVLVSLLIKLTGVQRFTEHWIFNLFFFRIFITLGISFLGAFAIKLPARWINAMAQKAKTNDFKGIFIMAVTLPGTSFSSTFPMVGLVLLLAGNVPVIGPALGLFGFAAGLALPFVFPVLLNIFARSKSVLNNIKVIMGFLSLMIALKFLSKADISLGLHLVDRDIFILVWMLIWAIMGIYMLGGFQLSHDTEREQNMFGLESIPLSRVFIAIIAFVFALYLLPGMWGAPLNAVGNFLPQ